MIYGIYAVRDVKSAFMPCINDTCDAAAIRNFEKGVSNDTFVMQHPTDFALYKIGTYDVDTGEITACTPTLLCDAAQFVRKEITE